VALSRARAVTEIMLHDAVDTARPRELASSACIGPLDNGAMRAAMRWHSSLVRAASGGEPCPAFSSRARTQTTMDETAASDGMRDGASGPVNAVVGMSDRSTEQGGVADHRDTARTLHCTFVLGTTSQRTCTRWQYRQLHIELQERERPRRTRRTVRVDPLIASCRRHQASMFRRTQPYCAFETGAIVWRPPAPF
jgi:hypothetical protein